jgi:branched-chain amino acid transport system ATP-binding protein
MSDRLFEIRNLTMQFGGVTALSDVNLHVSEGEIAALIGPNGAGKTTVFNVSTGYYSPTSGDVLLNNESIVGLKSNKIARKGLARTFQNIRLFGDMT